MTDTQGNEQGSKEARDIPGPKKREKSEVNKTRAKIEKGVPIPTNGGRGRKTIYDFLGMEPGDSFPIPKSEAGRVRPLANYYQKKMNKEREAQGKLPIVKFITKGYTENGEELVRVWRKS